MLDVSACRIQGGQTVRSFVLGVALVGLAALALSATLFVAVPRSATGWAPLFDIALYRMAEGGDGTCQRF